MSKFSPDDLDRSWSSDEVHKLSDRELTILAFLRDRKNFLFFFPQALILYFVALKLGVFGQVLGWVGIVLFSLFVLQNAFNLVVGVFVLVTSPFVADESEKNSFLWKAVAVLLMARTKTDTESSQRTLGRESVYSLCCQRFQCRIAKIPNIHMKGNGQAELTLFLLILRPHSLRKRDAKDNDFR